MRLIALKTVYYPSSGGGIEYQAGDTFDTHSDKDAEVLVAVGMAEYPKKAAPPKKTLTLKTPLAIETTTAAPLADKNLNEAPGAYRRRDMRSED